MKKIRFLLLALVALSTVAVAQPVMMPNRTLSSAGFIDAMDPRLGLGAVGDCSADDKAALDRAVTATPSGGTLYLGSGSCWAVASTWEITKAITVDIGGRTIRNTGTGDAVRFSHATPGLAANILYSAGIRNGTITRATAITTGAALALRRTGNFFLSNLYLAEHYEGLRIEGAINSQYNNVTAYAGTVQTSRIAGSAFVRIQCYTISDGDGCYDGFNHQFTALRVGGTTNKVIDYGVDIGAGDDIRFDNSYIGTANLAAVRYKTNSGTSAIYDVTWSNAFFDGVTEGSGTPIGWKFEDDAATKGLSNIACIGCMWGQYDYGIYAEDNDLTTLQIIGGNFLNNAIFGFWSSSTALRLVMSATDFNRNGYGNAASSGAVYITGAASTNISGTSFAGINQSNNVAITLAGSQARAILSGLSFTTTTTQISNTATFSEGITVGPTQGAGNTNMSGIPGIALKGSTSGSVTLKAPAVAGTNTITWPAGTTDFSATGGSSQVVKQTSAGGALSVAQLAASDLSNGTSGSGAVCLATSCAMTTPSLGVASATSINGLTLTSSTGTLTLTNGKTFAVTNGLTLSGTDSTTMTFPTTSATIARTDAANVFTGNQTVNGALTVNNSVNVVGTSTNGDLSIKSNNGNSYWDLVATQTTGDFIISDANNSFANVVRLEKNAPTQSIYVKSSGNVGFQVGSSPTAVVHLKAGTTAASSAPLKFTSGSLMTTAEAGAVEFLTDAFYGTITTGAARKTFAFLESPAFTGTITVSAIASNTDAQSGYLCYNTTGGVITYDGTNTCLVSSERYKENIAPLDSGLDSVMRLRPVRYTLKPEHNPSHIGEQIGFTAEQVYTVEPRVVPLDEEGKPRSVDYERITAMLTKAVQEQQAQIEALKAELAKLKPKKDGE